ncbi:hypothetical protein P879_10764 [Paragonimus westermani]|uniref:Uncharacterized protein n=1 Tax=Paragonimus westermani TaxID=34504 RepID=A0A8T0D5K5_9TREM|nr:hypothetical protein P879_10764 [Paragonimus westermani]
MPVVSIARKNHFLRSDTGSISVHYPHSLISPDDAVVCVKTFRCINDFVLFFPVWYAHLVIYWFHQVLFWVYVLNTLFIDCGNSSCFVRTDVNACHSHQINSFYINTPLRTPFWHYLPIA